ncbi:hypothetical protein LY78DRAFT_676608 [Colletotrichum sublineola]|nr:hypothetical protein LY78DRAFT_676608 [Colletotrichum sublineola]
MRGLNLTHLLATGEYSDLTINASGVIYRAHRCIVFPQCEAWKNMPEVNDQLILMGPNVTRAILEFMYSGTYTPIDIPCRLTEPPHTAIGSGKTGKSSAAAKESQDQPNTHDSDTLRYDDHSMLLSACVMTKAKEYKMKDLESQAKKALVAVAPSLTEHAEFICTIEHILNHYRDQKGLETVLQMIKPVFSKSACMRRRLQGVMRSYPRLAVELLEPLMLELDKWESGSALIAQGQRKTTNGGGAGVPLPVVTGCSSGSMKSGVLPAVAIQVTKKEKRPKLHQNAGVSFASTLSAAPTGAASLATIIPVPRPTANVPKKRKNEEQLLELEK